VASGLLLIFVVARTYVLVIPFAMLGILLAGYRLWQWRWDKQAVIWYALLLGGLGLVIIYNVYGYYQWDYGRGGAVANQLFHWNGPSVAATGATLAFAFMLITVFFKKHWLTVVVQVALLVTAMLCFFYLAYWNDPTSAPHFFNRFWAIFGNFFLMVFGWFVVELARKFKQPLNWGHHPCILLMFALLVGAHLVSQYKLSYHWSLFYQLMQKEVGRFQGLVPFKYTVFNAPPKKLRPAVRMGCYWTYPLMSVLAAPSRKISTIIKNPSDTNNFTLDPQSLQSFRIPHALPANSKFFIFQPFWLAVRYNWQKSQKFWQKVKNRD
jgi:hypothetical protein